MNWNHIERHHKDKIVMLRTYNYSITKQKCICNYMFIYLFTNLFDHLINIIFIRLTQLRKLLAQYAHSIITVNIYYERKQIIKPG